MQKSVISKKVTPEQVSKTNEVYSIPIYQRLFEWDEPRINQLLSDLYLSFKKDCTKPYYVGMLTSNSKNYLIDGQQRFTVMMLLGLVLRKVDESWNDFLFTNGKPRLFFIARTDDNVYMKNYCQSSSYENLYMKRGIACIQDFMNELSEKQQKAFAHYIFKYLTFFISRLPMDYSPKALNKYFETMNSTGKNLENHEILKVKMLQNAKRLDKVQLALIWNVVSDMDQPLIRRRKDERQYQVDERFVNAYNCVLDENLDGLFYGDYINALSQDAKLTRTSFPKIGEINASEDKPVQQRISRNNGFHSILSFSEFLLQILWLTVKKAETHNVNDFFDVNKMQETFMLYWDAIDIDTFIISLLRYRLLFDRYVINISNEKATYELDVNDDAIDEEGNHYHDLLIMYEAMLYVNSSSKSYYLWLPSLLNFVSENEGDCEDVYRFIKSEDEKRHPFSSITDDKSLSYVEVDRYWFWKLDFYLWSKRRSLFKDEKVRNVADHYIFRRNRSIEHIAPQTPEKESTLSLTDEVENCFGNLVMISSSQNSSLLNSTFEVKRAKVLSYVTKELNGSIESLKMLLIYQYDHWNESTITLHQNCCIKYLEESFK